MSIALLITVGIITYEVQEVQAGGGGGFLTKIFAAVAIASVVGAAFGVPSLAASFFTNVAANGLVAGTLATVQGITLAQVAVGVFSSVLAEAIYADEEDKKEHEEKQRTDPNYNGTYEPKDFSKDILINETAQVLNSTMEGVTTPLQGTHVYLDSNSSS